MGQAEVRGYTVGARSTDTFGRVLCNTRNQHFVVDVLPWAADDGGVVLAQQRVAHALQVCFARLQIGQVAQGVSPVCASVEVEADQAVAVCAAATFLAADCTAFTMFW